MLDRSDLGPAGTPDKNAGNSGDLGKHSAYLSLLGELRSQQPWSEELHLVEGHCGKGIYASTSPHWRDFQNQATLGGSPLLAAEQSILGPPPGGVGTISNLQRGERPYAGSSVLHAHALQALPRRGLTC